MHRFLWSLITLLPLLFWERLSPFLFGPADPAQVPAGRTGLARGVAQFVGGSGLSETAAAALSLLALVYSIAFGLLTHFLLADKGLGSKLNGFVGMIGGGAVVALWFLLVPKSAFSYSAIFFTAIVGSTALLAAVCVLKSLVLSLFDDYMSGASTPARNVTSARVISIASRRR